MEKDDGMVEGTVVVVVVVVVVVLEELMAGCGKKVAGSVTMKT
jgi:hypothetical protein